MITVYLDTADYSRFGDVERGIADKTTEALFGQLLWLKDRGIARFAYSMPILSELLQYNANHADTSLAKARAVERLCDSNAFIWPMGIVGSEMAHVAHESGWISSPPLEPVLSDKARWFPNVEGALVDLKADFQRSLDRAVAEWRPANRQQKRLITAKVRRLRIPKMGEAAAPELARKYGLRPSDVRGSLIAVLEDRISPDEGAIRLFSAIAVPTTFIQTYFVQYRGTKDFPFWMSDFGARVQETVANMRQAWGGRAFNAAERRRMRASFASLVPSTGEKFIELGQDEARRMGLTQPIIDRFRFDPLTANRLDSYKVMTTVLTEFFLLNTGVISGGHKPERSAGGDLFHSLYLPHCDLWRTDRRFGHLVRQALPAFKQRVVTTLAELPSAIERLAASRAGDS